MAAFTSPHPSSYPCSNIRQAHPPMLAWPHEAAIAPSQPCNIHANTHLSIPISTPIPPLATFFSLCPRIHHHSHLHARESSSVAGERAAAKQAFHSPRTSPELFLGFGAAASVRSASLQAIDGGLLAVLFDCSRGVVDGALSGDVHLLAPWLRKPCIPAVSVSPPLPLSFTSLLVEASPEEAARMERDALGCEGAFVWRRAWFSP